MVTYPQILCFSGQFGAGKDAIAAAVAERLAPGRWTQMSFARALKQEVSDLYVSCEHDHVRPRFAYVFSDGTRVTPTHIEYPRPLRDDDVAELEATPTAPPCPEPLEDGSACGSKVENPVDGFARSPGIRRALQWHGTEIRRSVDDGYWVRITLGAAREAITRGEVDLVVITDVRFPSEVDAIHQAGGEVIRLQISPEVRDARLLARDGHLPPPGAADHPSETALNDYTNFDYVVSNDGTMEETLTQIFDYLDRRGQQTAA